MNIALLGYGKMGKAIEKIAQERGHTIVQKLDKGDTFTPDGVDIAIDFSLPEAAVSNISSCINNGVPVVSGTTGWLDQYDEMVALCKEKGSAFLYASNFSVGVNLFFELNKKLASLMNNQMDYKVGLEEIHHTQKLDAPSGTAITVAEGVIQNAQHSKWELQEGNAQKYSNRYVPIQSVREGKVPGTHTVTYTSPIDTITISHEAHSRQGFAMGAVVAAEWLLEKKGVFSMRDVLNLS
jgi:4-hydroxy-tetrahydrodipicolinate reductase